MIKSVPKSKVRTVGPSLAGHNCPCDTICPGLYSFWQVGVSAVRGVLRVVGHMVGGGNFECGKCLEGALCL